MAVVDACRLGLIDEKVGARRQPGSCCAVSWWKRSSTVEDRCNGLADAYPSRNRPPSISPWFGAFVELVTTTLTSVARSTILDQPRLHLDDARRYRGKQLAAATIPAREQIRGRRQESTCGAACNSSPIACFSNMSASPKRPSGFDAETSASPDQYTTKVCQHYHRLTP